MSEKQPTPGSDAPISAKMDRIREIIEILEDGKISLERATELHEEGRELLAAVEDDVDLGEGTVFENQ